MIKARLGELFVKYILPFLWAKGLEFVKDVAFKIGESIKQELFRRAQAKDTAKAKEKWDSIANDPASTPEQRADAYQDYINSKPS